ncbi:hypothetical protein QOZ80_7BG0590880 [Eleusine coracana subsp. coracana]|nr:hypothetical protein QOZ80_7BG0590880 [Eleusine coracana subsp. coracana]
MASPRSISTARDQRRRILAATTSDDGILPTDALRGILLRLPARHLCRFRSVCRSWRSLLSEPDFVKAHASLHPSPLVAVAVTSGECSNTVDFIVLDMSGKKVKRIPAGMWSFDAQISSHQYLAGIAVDDYCRCLRMVNLESGAISLVPKRFQRARALPAGFVHGRAASGEHKVIRIRNTSSGAQYCDVLTLGSGGDYGNTYWRRGQPPPVPVHSRYRGSAVVVKGIAYFLVDRIQLYNSEVPGDVTLDDMATFDLSTEQWSLTLLHGPLSSDIQKRQHRPQLTALKGRLVVIHPRYEGGPMDLWFRVGTSLDDAGWPIWFRRYANIRFGVPLWELDDGRLAVWMWSRKSWTVPDDYMGMLSLYDPKTRGYVTVAELDNFVGIVGVDNSGKLSSS